MPIPPWSACSVSTQKHELQSHNLRDLYVHAGERDVLVREIESNGSFRDREIQLRRKDGQVIYCLASGFAIRDTFGNVARLQGTLVDITERREIERQPPPGAGICAAPRGKLSRLDCRSRPGRPVHLCKPQREGYFGRRARATMWARDLLAGRIPRTGRKLEAIFSAGYFPARNPARNLNSGPGISDGGWKNSCGSARALLWTSNGKIAGVVASARDVTESEADRAAADSERKVRGHGPDDGRGGA